MKLSCNVARDLLPLYHDGVCSDESRALVESHVAGCEACRGLLRELRGEIDVPHERPDDLAPLGKIGRNVKQGKKRAWLKGMAAALAVVLVLGGTLAGLNGYQEQKYRDQIARFAEGQELLEDTGDGYPYDYDWIHGNYLFRVTLPTDGIAGTIEVREYKWTKDLANPNDLVQISLRILFQEDGYLYQITVEDSGYTYSGSTEEMAAADWAWETVTLDQNGQTVHDESWDDVTIARKDALVEHYRSEILNIITAAEREWPFLKE